MFTRNILRVILVSIFLVSASNGEESDRVEKLKAGLTSELEGSFAKDIGPRLSNSGMAKTDIDRIVEEIAISSASCLVDALVQQSEEQSLDTEKILADAEASLLDKAGDDFADVLDVDGLKQRMEYCALLAIENAGVQIP